MAARKSFLFVMRSPPHGGIQAQESLDMVLATAAYDHCVRLLFLDDGIFQLAGGQKPDAIGFKHIAPIFSALELYDVEELWVEEESLEERGLSKDRLIVPVRTIPRPAVAGFIGRQDIVVSC